MPKISPHPHVSWRAGRPRFQPGPDLRKAGHKGHDLRHPNGRWFSRGEAVDWSIAFAASLKPAPAKPAPAAGRKADRPSRVVARPAGAPGGAAAEQAREAYTVAALCAEWQRSRKFLKPAEAAELQRLRAAKAVYSPRTAAFYAWNLTVIERYHPVVWGLPVEALERPTLFGMYEELVESHGLSVARACIATLSAALSWGGRRGRHRLPANPAADLGMTTPPPRVRFATRAEIEALVAAADAAGRPEIGDMVILGVWTGQRQGDRLALEDNGLLNGRRRFLQGKTGARVAIREAPELESRLAASAERRRPARAAALLAAATPAERAEVEARFRRVILNETVDKRHGKCFWRPYTAMHYSHEFTRLRRIAARTCPTLADFQELDLRDTAVTWLALAGCDIPEICAVTGHSLESATRVLRHYLAMHPELADSAIDKMVAWYAGHGETEIGL